MTAFGKGQGKGQGEAAYDHAGGPASLLLSYALAATHDGVAGNWDPSSGPTKQPTFGGKNDGDLSYLNAETRGDLVDAILRQAFSVTGAVGTATLSRSGKDILTLTRPGAKVFRDQMRLVRAYADLRIDRAEEIFVQIDDLLSFFGTVGLLDTGRRRNSLELLSAVIRLAEHVEMPLKHYCRAARPIDWSPKVQPMIQTPDHSTYPAGHALECFAAATVLHRLMSGKGPKGQLDEMPFRIAHRIAVNRVVAGVHFPVDNAAGALLGLLLGEAVFALACGKAPPTATATAPDFTKWAGDVTPDVLDQALPADQTGKPDTATPLGWLWDRAQAEWR